jgi:hypothetical protein
MRRKRYDVFVSYSHKDAATVKPLVQVLSIAKRRVYWDEIIRPGQDWTVEIETALAASDAIVIMWCCDSAASDWVTREIETARKLEKPLTPIQLCAYPLQGPVTQFQAVNLSGSLRHNCGCAAEARARESRERTSILQRDAPSAFFGFALQHPQWHSSPPPRVSSLYRARPSRKPGRFLAWMLEFLVSAMLWGVLRDRNLSYTPHGFVLIEGIAGFLAVVLLDGAVRMFLNRREASRTRRAAETVSIIEEALRRSGASARQ